MLLDSPTFNRLANKLAERAKEEVRVEERVYTKQSTIKILQVRFGSLDSQIIDLINGVTDSAKLSDLTVTAGTCKDLAEFVERLRS